jgi:membrane-associated phospholipid phosphatase
MRLLITAAANPSDPPIYSPDHLRSSTRNYVVALLWLSALALAFALDRPLALWLRDTGVAHTIKSSGRLKDLAKFPGLAWCTLLLLVPLILWHPLRWRAAIFLALCALIAGVNSIVKWTVGRFRPFVLPPIDQAQPFHVFPFNGGLPGLFHQTSGLSFVSGHTSLAFATAAGLAVLFSKRRWVVYLVYTIAAIVFLERIGENAHWLSDAVGGAALGIWGVALLARCCRGNLLPAKN